VEQRLKKIEKIIEEQMKAANAYCCESLKKILEKIKELDWTYSYRECSICEDQEKDSCWSH